MRTPITLQEFLFTLNQDEDMLVTIIDYDTNEKIIIKEWKDGFRYSSQFQVTCYDEIKDYFVQDFTLILGGLEITIVKSKEELD